MVEFKSDENISEVVMVGVNDIIEHDGNRKNEGELEPLASVKEMGIKIPLLAYKDKRGDFHLVDGHRRLYTAKLLGMDYVPVIFIDKETAEETYAVANLDRKDLTTLDLYERAKEMQKLGNSNETIADTLHVSKYQLARFLKLDNLIPEYMDLLKKGTITSAQASEFAAFSEETQKVSIKNKYLLKSDAKLIRTALNQLTGKPLDKFSDELIRYDAVCMNCLDCPNNRGTDMTLFGSATKEESVCTCPEKLAMKLLAFSTEKNCNGIIPEFWDSEWLTSNGINPVHKEYMSFEIGEPKKGYEGQLKYMTEYGYICWQGGTDSTSTDDHRKALKELVESFNEKLYKFVCNAIDNKMIDAANGFNELIASNCHKKLYENIISHIKDECPYTLREDATEYQKIARALYEITVSPIRYVSVPIYSNEETIKKEIDECIKKWEPLAISYPEFKKEWASVIKARKNLEDFISGAK